MKLDKHQRWQEISVTKLKRFLDRAHLAGRAVCYWTAQTARLMVGVPDYQTYVSRRLISHPREPVMTYQEFFRERQDVRYTITKGRLKGCC